eukprot:4154102-Pyramimonas_sp.AAC.1
MDEVTRTHTILQEATASAVTEQLNGATSRLEQTIGKGGWRLNQGKTNHLLCICGPGSYTVTRQLRRSTELKGEALREMRVFGPYLPSDQGLGGRSAQTDFSHESGLEAMW